MSWLFSLHVLVKNVRISFVLQQYSAQNAYFLEEWKMKVLVLYCSQYFLPLKFFAFWHDFRKILEINSLYLMVEILYLKLFYAIVTVYWLIVSSLF